MAESSQHWYTKDGRPCYEVPRAKGEGMRPATLADARKLGLVPGVTGVVGMVARPGLERWKRQQLLLAALTLPRLPGESADAFAKRALEDAEEEARAAAERGSDIHAEVASLCRGEGVEVSLGARNAWQLTTTTYGEEGWIAEHSFADFRGFGGRVDLHRPRDIVLDYKSVDDLAAKDKVAWPEHCAQLAAYMSGLGMLSTNRGVNVYVCRKSGLVRLHEWSGNDIIKGWERFRLCLALWKLEKDFDPSW